MASQPPMQPSGAFSQTGVNNLLANLPISVQKITKPILKANPEAATLETQKSPEKSGIAMVPQQPNPVQSASHSITQTKNNIKSTSFII